MGLYTPIFSEAGASIEFAIIDLMDFQAQRLGLPGVDDVMGSIFMEDSGNGIGARVRPVSRITIRAKVSSWPKYEEQVLDQIGNDPDSKVVLTLYEDDLLEQGLLLNGVLRVKPDDRLIRLLNSDGIQADDGTIRADFAANGRLGLRCEEVRWGLTGERRVLMFFESQRASASGK